MVDKKKDKEFELLGGAQPIDPAASANPEQLLREEQAGEQHEILVENIEAHRCPYHGQDLKIEREKRTVKKLDDAGRETAGTKEITVRFAVCTCKVPGGNNPYRGKRVWEQA